MKERALTGIIIVIVILLGGVGYVAWNSSKNSEAPAPIAEVPMGVVYTNQNLGITFTQPDGYHLASTLSSEIPKGGDISLIEEGAYKEFIESTEPREAPPSILLSVLAQGDAVSIEEWLEDNKMYSQYDGGPLEPLTVAGVKAVSYEADGLYLTRYVAFALDERVFLLSVQFLDRTDALVSDFNRIIQTLTISS